MRAPGRGRVGADRCGDVILASITAMGAVMRVMPSVAGFAAPRHRDGGRFVSATAR